MVSTLDTSSHKEMHFGVVEFICWMHTHMNQVRVVKVRVFDIAPRGQAPLYKAMRVPTKVESFESDESIKLSPL